jgi:hypothetical protein
MYAISDERSSSDSSNGGMTPGPISTASAIS